VIPCGDMHQSFTGTLVKWFIDKFPMFADSVSVVSIHCVARGLGASFLYKCPALRGGSVRQHCLLILTRFTSVHLSMQMATFLFLNNCVCNNFGK